MGTELMLLNAIKLPAHLLSQRRVALLPGGRRAITLKGDLIRVWDLGTGVVEKVIPASSWVFDIAAGAGSHAILSSARRVLLLDLIEGTVHERTPPVERGHFRMNPPHVACSPDGKLGLWFMARGIAQVWALEGGKLQYTLDHPGWIGAAAFSPDCAHIVTSSGADLFLWDAATGVLLDRSEIGGSAVAVSFTSPEVGILALCENSDVVHWSFDRGPSVVYERGGRTKGGAIGSYGDLALSIGDQPGAIDVFSVREQTGFTLEIEGGAIRSLAASPDTDVALTASFDGSLKLWDLRQRRELGSYSVDSAPDTLEFLEQGDRCVVAGLDGRVRLVDVHTGSVLRDDRADAFFSRTFVMPGGEAAILAATNGTAYEWGFGDAGGLRKLEARHIRAVSRDGRFALLWDDWTRQAHLWDLERGCLAVDLGRVQDIHASGFADEGDSVVIVSQGEQGLTVTRIEFATDSETADIQARVVLEVEATALSLSPSGNYAVTDEGGGLLGVWSLVEAHRLFTVGGEGTVVRHGDGRMTAPSSIAWAPDELRILTTSGNVLRLWDLPSRRLVSEVVGPTRAGIRGAWFVPTGVGIAAMLEDGHLATWDLDVSSVNGDTTRLT